MCAQGDVSNRGKAQSSKAKGRAGAAASRNVNPAEEGAPRRSSRNRGSTATNDISVLDEATADDDDMAPKRRRSTRSCVLAQRVNNDESNRSDESDTQAKPKAVAKKAKAKSTQARGRATKRPREEEEEDVAMKKEAKKAKRSSSSKGKKTTAKKSSSKSSRKGSTSRGSRKKQSSEAPRKPCSEFLTQTNYELVREPFDSSKFTLGIAPHDQANKDDVNEVSNYTTDIFQRLYYAEVRLVWSYASCCPYLDTFTNIRPFPNHCSSVTGCIAS